MTFWFTLQILLITRHFCCWAKLWAMKVFLGAHHWRLSLNSSTYYSDDVFFNWWGWWWWKWTNMIPLSLAMCCSLSDSKGEAASIETELLRDYRFGQQQLIEIWGQACALAITKVCTLSIFHIYVVVCVHVLVSIFLLFFLDCLLSLPYSNEAELFFLFLIDSKSPSIQPSKCVWSCY